MQCDGSTPAHRYLHRLNRMHPQCLSKLHGIYPFVHAISSDRSPSHSLHPPEVSTPLPSAPRNIHTQTESRFHTSFRSANQRFHRSTTWDIRFRGAAANTVNTVARAVPSNIQRISAMESAFRVRFIFDSLRFILFAPCLSTRVTCINIIAYFVHSVKSRYCPILYEY